MASHRIPFEAASAAERTRLIAENDRLREQLRDRHRLADLAGGSPAIVRVRELIEQVGPSDRAVWVHGEPGVGKGRVARAIHSASPRAAGPFVVVSGSALPDADVEAQLVGLPAAASITAAGGCLGRAEGGTLFVDDLAVLGPAAQDALLRVARDRAWARGDGRVGQSEVRLIVASGQGPAALAGVLRADLRQHLGALTVAVPPLRERRADLPVLIELFVEGYARLQGRAVRRVSDRATDMLTHYDWPGNVSELRRTIERAVALTTGPVVHHHHLPAEIQAAGTPVAPAGLSEALDAYEKELLQDALRQAHGVRSRAARLLMTSERVFSYRLRKHGIDSRLYRA